MDAITEASNEPRLCSSLGYPSFKLDFMTSLPRENTQRFYSGSRNIASALR